MKKRKLLYTYLLRPFRLIKSNKSILILFLGILVLDHLSNIDIKLTPKWIYETLPELFLSGVKTPLLIFTFLVIFFAQAFITVLIAQDMFSIYTGNRKGVIQSVSSIEIPNITWFFKYEIGIIVLFSLIAGVFYFPSLFVWQRFQIDLSSVFFAAFFILYPVFYACISFIVMFAVLPLNNNQRIEKLKSLFTLRRLLKIYSFYFARVSIELFLVIIFPFIIITFLKIRWLASLSVAIGLMIPFAVIRGSSYEFKLSMFSQDPDMQNIFQNHYSDQIVSVNLP